MKRKTNIKTLDQFVDENYGKRGSPKREKFEKGYEEGHNDATRKACKEIAKNYRPNPKTPNNEKRIYT